MNSEIQESGKKFEFIVLQHDPMYDVITAAIPVVKKFIKDNGLIIYGGTAIDYALRLKGDSIYDENALNVPDLDFYSPDSIEHAYALADILYDSGNLAARAIVGMHTDTMRVDIGKNHFIADIHYVPKEMFDKLPHILYEEMKCIHPNFQRIDLHSSLAFPFDDPPREVIFNRWAKDVKRFGKLHLAYPPPSSGSSLRTVRVQAKASKYVFAGAAAYAIITGNFQVTGGNTIEFEAPRKVIELVAMNPEKTARELGVEIDSQYEPLGGVMPKKVIAGVYEISSMHHRLLSIISVEISSGVFVRVVCVQYLLRHYAAAAWQAGTTPLGEDCWARYTRLLELVFAGAPNTRLSLQTYGSENISHSRRHALQKLFNALDGDSFPPTPATYYPANAPRTRDGREHPFFNPEANPVFCARGRLMTGTARTQ
jgi:hypothetical protein